MADVRDDPNPYGYWGKYHGITDPHSRHVIWIGPMYRTNMMADFYEFKHKFAGERPEHVDPPPGRCLTEKDYAEEDE